MEIVGWILLDVALYFLLGIIFAGLFLRFSDFPSESAIVLVFFYPIFCAFVIVGGVVFLLYSICLFLISLISGRHDI